MRTPFRVAAGLGTSLALTVCATPALAAPGSSTTPAPVASTTSSTPQAVRAVPPFPGIDSSEAQLQAWAEAVAAAYHLPVPPGESASEAAWSAYLNKVMDLLGAPSPSSSPQTWQAWFTATAPKLGLPTPPAAGAGEEAWLAWYQKAFGVDMSEIADLFDSMGTSAILSDGYCAGGTGHVDVSAVNLSSTPTSMKVLLDSQKLVAKISLAGSSLSADEPVSYEGTVSVPNGRHVVSLVDRSTGEVLDSVTTRLTCRTGGAATATGPTKTAAAPRPGGSKVLGPVVQTDHLALGSADSGLVERAGVAGLVAALIGAGAAGALGRRRFSRR